MPITKMQAAAAADLIRTIRPGWDAMATTNVLAEMCEVIPFPAVLAAALAAAANPENRSPLSIKWTEPPDNRNSSGGKYSPEPRCAICGMHFTRCRYIAGKTRDRHQFADTD